MNVCPKCGTQTVGSFCPQCGTKTNAIQPVPETQPAPATQPAPETKPAPKSSAQSAQTAVKTQRPIEKDDLPAKFRPLSAWAYFGLGILYSIPVIGFIFLLIHTFSGKNINRRSFARSRWCWAIIVAVAAVIVCVIALCLGGFEFITNLFKF